MGTGSESGRTLLRACLRCWLRTWHDPYAVGRSPRRHADGRTHGNARHARRRHRGVEVGSVASSRSVRTVRTARNGCYRSRPPAPRGIRVRALGSRLVNPTVLRVPRSCFRSGLLRDAWAICNHAAPRGSKIITTPRNKDSSRDFADTSTAAAD